MKQLLLAILVSGITINGISQQSPVNVIIPAPASATFSPGYYNIPVNAVINASGGQEVTDIAKLFSTAVNRSGSYRTSVKTIAAGSLKTGPGAVPKPAIASPVNNATVRGINFIIDKNYNSGSEGYKLTITRQGIHVVAREAAGLFYGLQTLLQLLPAAIESPASGVKTWQVPFAVIEDQPCFAWRGIMLDVARHFFTVDEVKAYIDQMAKYKFNILHWHLADDQGWRIEIKSLPRLTSVGAWRVEKIGSFGDFSPPLPDEPRTYGGFYTHEQIREVVRYALSKQIEIVPEIDVPGHSMAAIAAYPQLSCTPGTHPVNSGEKLMEWPPSGHFYGLVDNNLCPANEEVYTFLDKVFTEIAQLFPFRYIHMGGDEAARNFWEKSDAIKQLMKKENLKDLNEVQSYFVKRVARIIESKGRKVIGWDEIMEGGIPPNAAVMSWHSLKEGAAAAKMGHPVVMTPVSHTYIDYMQSDVSMEPPVYASLRLNKVYEFEPLPDGVDPALVMGGQGNLWTEQVYNARQLQYMTWPRSLALAEVLWSPRSSRNWNNFVTRTEAQFPRFNAARVKYSPALYDPAVIVKGDSSQLLVELEPEIEGLVIHYSFDNSYPDEFYPAYRQALKVPKDASLMKLISYRNGKPVGRMMSIPIADLRKRLTK